MLRLKYLGADFVVRDALLECIFEETLLYQELSIQKNIPYNKEMPLFNLRFLKEKSFCKYNFFQ